MPKSYLMREVVSTTISRIRESEGDTFWPMDTKAILWANLRSLMISRYGKENLNRFYKESGVGLGNLSRIKAQETAVGLDVLDRIAEFFHIYTWQLLVPDLDPSNPPVVAITQAEKAFYDRIKEAAKTLSNLPQ